MSGEATSKPSAEPVLKVESREELVYLLSQACEIEHGLLCEYLYAQFSLKRGPDEGLTEAQLARVQAWEKALAQAWGRSAGSKRAVEYALQQA